MNTINKTTISLVTELKDALASGLEAWEAAGQCVVSLLDVHGLTLEQIAEASGEDFITPNLVAQFERIGRKQVLPRLLVSESPASRHLQKLPLSEQTRLMDGNVELFILKSGKPDVLSVAVKDLTSQQCKQVFDKHGVRSLGAQRAFVEARAQEEEIRVIKSENAAPWVVKNGRVVFRESCEVSRHDLAMILAQLS
jgi:hypothetical protein